MSREELLKIAMEKNSKGIATKRALAAQEKLWKERIVINEMFEDSYSGEVDYWDEKVHLYLDAMEAFRI